MPAVPVTQLDVRATMAHLGGYWPAPAGVLRLLEELGEVAELLGGDGGAPADDDRATDGRAGDLAEELADVWIISTVVADQFLAEVVPLHASGAPVADRPSDAGLVAAPPSFAQLVAGAGQIARVVNHYDGPKAPRTLADWTGIQPAIDAFHGALRAFAAARGVDLRSVVGEKLERSRAVDADRFPRTFDPSTAPVLERLRAARPDLAHARLFGAPDWPDGPFALGIADVVRVLRTFLKAAAAERLDGLVVPLPADGPIVDAANEAAARADGSVDPAEAAAAAGSARGLDRVLLELRGALVGHADGEADAFGDVFPDEFVVELVELGDDRAVLVRH